MGEWRIWFILEQPAAFLTLLLWQLTLASDYNWSIDYKCGFKDFSRFHIYGYIFLMLISSPPPPPPMKRAKRIQLVHFHCCDILKTPCPTATGSLSGWGFPFYIALFLEWSVLGWNFRHSNMKLTTSWDKYDCCKENTGASFSWVVLATMATGVWSREGTGCTNIALCSGRMRWLPAKTLGWHLDLVVRDKVTLTTWLADNMVLVIP